MEKKIRIGFSVYHVWFKSGKKIKDTQNKLFDRGNNTKERIGSCVRYIFVHNLTKSNCEHILTI